VVHPEVQAALDNATAFRHTLDYILEQIDQVRARRPSPGGWVIPEVDGRGRLTDLYIAPGTIERLTNEQLSAEIMAAIQESTADASRQHVLVIEETLKESDRRTARSGRGPTGPQGPRPHNPPVEVR